MEPVEHAVGARVKRVEDPRILTGKGRYVDDVVLPGMLHAAFLRSYLPHGRIISVDATEARALPGVVAVYTGEDIARLTEPVTPGVHDGHDLRPGHALAGVPRPGHRQGPSRRRPDRPRRGREPLHRRGRARAHRRGHRAPGPGDHLRRRPRSHEGPGLGRGAGQRPPAIRHAARRRRCRLRQGRPDAHGHHRGPPSPAGADGVPGPHRRLRQGDRAPHAPRVDPVAPHVPPGPARPRSACPWRTSGCWRPTWAAASA